MGGVEHATTARRAPPVPDARRRRARPRRRARRALAAASRPFPARPRRRPPAGAPPATTGAPGAAAKPVVVKTDLYTAEIDPVGGVIAQVALAQHRDAFDTSKPYLALQRNAERTFVAQAGLLGDGHAQPPHASTRCCPGRASSRRAQDKLDVKLDGDRGERRQGRRRR